MMNLNKPSNLGKTIIFLTLSFTLSANGNNTRTISRANEAMAQIQLGSQKEVVSEPETPTIVRENTVVFYCISQEDFDALVAKDPDRNQPLVELISDFVHYAGMVADKLETWGISTEFTSRKEIMFRLPKRKSIKRTFNPADIYGLALFPLGEFPLIARSLSSHDYQPGERRIGSDYFSMAEVISNYFGVNLELGDIDWVKIRDAFRIYCDSPSIDNAKKLLLVMPKHYNFRTTDFEQRSSTIEYIYEAKPFEVLYKLVRKGDRFSIRIAYSTLVISDGAAAVMEDLCSVIGDSIKIDPTLFLEETLLFDKKYNQYLPNLLGSIVAGNIDPKYRPVVVEKEILIRIKSLNTVKQPDLIELRDACIQILEERLNLPIG